MEHKSSINFKAVKANSERHNKAENRKTLDYVRTDLTHNNTQWMATSISKKRKEIIQRHNEYHTEVKTFICPKTGKEKTTKRLKKKFHSTAVPIKEAVVNLKRQSTWKDLLKVAEVIEKDFGPRCFQAFIHKDEGRYADQQDIDRGKATRINQWIPNSHAHLLFDWTDKVTGRPLRLNQLAMRKIQTKVADVLGMERGVEGSKAKRLESFDYKLNQSQKKLEALKKETTIAKQKQKKLEQEMRGFDQKKLEALEALEKLQNKKLRVLDWFEKKQTIINQVRDLTFDEIQQIKKETKEQKQQQVINQVPQLTEDEVIVLQATEKSRKEQEAMQQVADLTDKEKNELIENSLADDKQKILDDYKKKIPQHYQNQIIKEAFTRYYTNDNYYELVDRQIKKSLNQEEEQARNRNSGISR